MHLTPPDYLGNGFPMKPFSGCWSSPWRSGRGYALFTYAVTIQNHQAYTAGKYGFVPDPPETTVSLSDAASTYLSVYFKGLQDSANMLERLTQYLDSLDESYLLVFSGDHQPNLGGNYLAYRELDPTYGSTDTVADTLQPYTVPYLIWGNAAYQQDHDLLAQAQVLNLPETISSHYLGALTCQLAGFQGYDGYVDLLNDLRTQLPVSSIYGYQLPDGSYTRHPSLRSAGSGGHTLEVAVLSHEGTGRPIKFRSFLPNVLCFHPREKF